MISQSQMQHPEKVSALARLLRVLPLGAVAKVCNASVADLASMDADRLANHFVTRGRRALWSVGFMVSRAT